MQPVRSIVFLWIAWLAASPGALAQSREESGSDTLQLESGEAISSASNDKLARTAREIIVETNKFRAEHDRDEVAVDGRLREAAQYFAEYMAREGKYGHQADGRRPSERAKKHGYAYCIVLENIAYRGTNERPGKEKLSGFFFRGWKNSPEHRRNMLDPDVTEIGVGLARTEGTGQYFGVQMFGWPRSKMIDFRIANRSGGQIEYRVGEKNFTLEDNMLRVHHRCRLPRLKFAWQQEEESYTPRAGARYMVRGEGNVAVETAGGE